MAHSKAFKPAEESASLEQRLAAFPFFAELSSQGIQELLSGCRTARSETLQQILSSGDSCEALVLLERGSVRVFKRAPSGREIVLYRVLPGESCVLGTTCLLQGSCYPAEAEMEAGTDALMVDAGTFRELYAREVSVRQFVMSLYAKRLDELMLLVEEVAFQKMDERLVHYLLKASRLDDASWKPVEMSHEELAAELGTAREVVSRVLNQLAEEGSVALERRRIRILDPGKLSGVLEK